MSAFFTTYDGLALLLSAAIFLITVFLLSIRAIGFWLALLLLLFTLATGLVVGNFSVMREYFLNSKGKQVEQLQNDLSQVKGTVEHLQSETASFKETLQKQMEQLRSEYASLREQVDHISKPHDHNELDKTPS